MKIREIAIGVLVCGVGAAVPQASAAGFVVNSGSYVQAIGGGSNTQPLYLGFNWTPGTTSTGAGSQPYTQLLANGLRIGIYELRTSYYPFGTGANAAVKGVLRFTPTVPNLSYTFNGFMNVVQTGAPASMSATNGVTLTMLGGMFNVIETQYASAYNGPCALWQPAAPSWGTQSGVLYQGASYELAWDFSLVMYHGGDTTADYQVKLKNDPYFQFLLFQRPCAGDLNGDGYVDDSDFAAFAMAYNILDCVDPLMPPGCPSDLNNDGYVDDADFVLFAEAYDALLCP
ncbi:MAG: hypothetical protein ACREJD_04975 [Phycisphaerales bacterium]